jgi:hypothetical protein
VITLDVITRYVITLDVIMLDRSGAVGVGNATTPRDVGPAASVSTRVRSAHVLADRSAITASYFVGSVVRRTA